jgi:hypothetical protein
MESITCTTLFEGSVAAMVSRSRTLESRACWPGATVDGDIPGTLFYTIGIRLKSASITDMHVEERLGDTLESDHAVWFESLHRCTWPDLVVDAKSVYRFDAGSPNTLTFTYSYENPGPKIVKAKNLPAFRSALERVIARYLVQLVSETSKVA